jgi:membrane-associated phospholipid phosphatase
MLIGATMLDAPTARFMQGSGCQSFLESHRIVREILKLPGWFPFTLVAVILPASLLHPRRWRAGLFMLLATATAASNQLFKFLLGRTRPFKPPDGSGRPVPFEVHPLAWHVKNLSFPSGHACLAFATAAALAMLWPRSRWQFVWYGVATLVAIERVAENAHWLSDAVFGAALGIAGARVIGWLLIGSWKSNPLTSRS